MINWNVTKEEARLISKIACRAVQLAWEHDAEWDKTDTEMDLTATHANGCPLDLEKLLAAKDFDLLHDVAGIRRHINRETGELGGCFVPRCALPEAAAK